MKGPLYVLIYTTLCREFDQLQILASAGVLKRTSPDMEGQLKFWGSQKFYVNFQLHWGCGTLNSRVV